MTLETLGQAALTAGIFIGLFILGYCGITHKTLTEVFIEIKELLSSKKEEILG